MSTKRAERELPAGLSVLLLLLIFAPVLVEWIMDAGRTARQSYTLLVPVLAAVLARRSARVQALAPPRRTTTEHRLASAILLGAALLYLAGSLTTVFSLALLGAPVAAVGWVAARGGRAGLARYRAALAYGFLAVPLPAPLYWKLNPPAIEWTGRVARALLAPLDPAVAWEGTTLTFQGWRILVAEACSGSGSLFTLLALALFLSALAGLGPSRALLVALASVPAALCVNAVRIAGTALAIERFGPAAAAGWPHEVLGQVLLLLAAVVLALGVSRLVPGAARTEGGGA